MATIAIVSPLSNLIGQYNPIVFTAVDTSPLVTVVAWVVQEGRLVTEIVHDGLTFSSTFTGQLNQRSSITGGYEFTILRDGGWKSDVTLHVLAVGQTNSSRTTSTWTVISSL